MPEPLRRLFARAGALTIDKETLAIYSIGRIEQKTALLQECWGNLAEGVTVFAGTPCTGASDLGILADGRIVDMWGYPNQPSKSHPLGYPSLRGQWYVIAGSPEEWLKRVAEEGLYWLPPPPG